MIKVGDVVRVRDPDGFVAAFSSKIRDRDAVVLNVYQSWGAPRCRLEFQKRNGRGKVFVETMRMSELVLRDAQESEE